jgi:hypothetical protein
MGQRDRRLITSADGAVLLGLLALPGGVGAQSAPAMRVTRDISITDKPTGERRDLPQVVGVFDAAGRSERLPLRPERLAGRFSAALLEARPSGAATETPRHSPLFAPLGQGCSTWVPDTCTLIVRF